jgi:hypothetical protein
MIKSYENYDLTINVLYFEDRMQDSGIDRQYIESIEVRIILLFAVCMLQQIRTPENL